MKSNLLLLFSMIFIFSCSRYNPCAPDLHGQTVDGPPQLYLSFDDTIKNLVDPTWASALYWWNDNQAKWNGFGVGWGESSDQAHDLAYNFWRAKSGDKNTGVGGICGNFAGFMIYACRIHGYKTGGVIYYQWDDDGQNCTGHIEAFVRDKDGKVITTSNSVVSHYKSYANLAEFKHGYDNDFNTKNSYCVYVDDHCNQMTPAQMQDYFREQGPNNK